MIKYSVLKKHVNGLKDGELVKYIIEESPISKKEIEIIADVSSWPRSKLLKRVLWLAESRANVEIDYNS